MSQTSYRPGEPCSGGLVDQEVRIAQELAIEEGGLEDDVGSGAQRELGFGVLGLEFPADGVAAFQ